MAGGRHPRLLRDRLAPADEIQRRLGLSFSNPALLAEALTHPSSLNENPGSARASYQRLEFLGDAILGAVVAGALFCRFPALSEGELTRFRAHLVQRKSLARIASDVNLGECLYMGRGEEAGGGRRRESNLASALEALIGAVWLDKGFAAASDLITGLLAAELQRGEAAGGVPKDPKSRLQEMAQAEGWPVFQYRVTSDGGASHNPVYTAEVWVEGRVLGVGAAKRKSDAEQEAAAKAIAALAESAGLEP